MSDPSQLPSAEAAAYRQGWRSGVALGALAFAVCAFINLLGAEKSIPAVALALIAIRGAQAGAARIRALAALAIAVVHLVLVAIVLVVFHDKLAQLLGLLQSLG
jgi:hypothetical protein